MRYEGQLYRPPSEADSLILQATIGCSHNLCTYCAMYRDKTFRIRPLEESLEDLNLAATRLSGQVEKLFVADGDALILPLEHWLGILGEARKLFPRLRRVSCYATAMNLLEKSDRELRILQEAGLSLLYIGPESGDDATLKRIVKGASHAEHAQAAQRAHRAGMSISAIFLLGVAGIEQSQVHAQASAELVSAMDPEFFSALTTTVVPGTPLARLENKGGYQLPSQGQMLRELRTMIDLARPTAALFRSNHASNYLPLRGQLPRDREPLLQVIDGALSGQIPLRPEWARGL